jgi:hypothetical protein
MSESVRRLRANPVPVMAVGTCALRCTGLCFKSVPAGAQYWTIVVVGGISISPLSIVVFSFFITALRFFSNNYKESDKVTRFLCPLFSLSLSRAYNPKQSRHCYFAFFTITYYRVIIKMKGSIALLIGSFAAQQVSATWDRQATNYNTPTYNNNQCSDKQKGGFNWTGTVYNGEGHSNTADHQFRFEGWRQELQLRRL